MKDSESAFAKVGEGEYEWYVLLVQYEHLIVKTNERYAEGYAWDYAFIQARSRTQATMKFKESRKCTLNAYRVGDKTQVLVHRVETLNEAMIRCDRTPTRKRLKRNSKRVQ